MSARSHSPARHRGRRKGKAGRNTERMPAQVGVGKGMPRFLSNSKAKPESKKEPKPKATQADIGSSSEHEARQGTTHDVSERPVETPLGAAAATAMQSNSDRGRSLGQSLSRH